MLREVNIKRYYKDGSFSEVKDSVLTESLLSIYVNGDMIAALTCLPESLWELAVGYLRTEGIISGLKDITDSYIDESSPNIYIKIKPEAEKSHKLFTTDSGDFYNRKCAAKNFYPPVMPELEFSPYVIIQNITKLLKHSDLFKKTGNIHSVMFCTGSDLVCFSEDIGRYNALDKCVGKAMLENFDMSRVVMYTSGRVPKSIIMKAVRAQISAIVSRSAPSAEAIELAKRYNQRLIGFAGNNHFNFYC